MTFEDFYFLWRTGTGSPWGHPWIPNADKQTDRTGYDVIFIHNSVHSGRNLSGVTLDNKQTYNRNKVTFLTPISWGVVSFYMHNIFKSTLTVHKTNSED